jgi:serine/threonine protein kinase/Tfp pilus assembly protein PilF
MQGVVVGREEPRPGREAAERLAHGLAGLPEVGTDFLGFQLLEELGRGTFGRVYLARQRDLAHRLVALKITLDAVVESQTLAQLQHTNVVPIYSVHRCGPFQAVCMPYFGATTLADLLKQWRLREALPNSGRELVHTLCHRRSVTRLESSVRPDDGSSILPAIAPDTPAPCDTEATAARGAGAGVLQSTAILDMLQELNYVQAVLWIAARLTDGLAHAHERGIFHRDLKPANILLTDEGQPMLLDFGVAQDLKLRTAPEDAPVGGTLPYMAPEHLEAMRGGPAVLTAGSDLYSFGVILYELLTRRHPFKIPPGAWKAGLAQMIAERRQPPPALRCWNPAVTPAVEAIVRRCLESDPARRYQTARQLNEDLERHRANLPLRHTPEPSLRERARKWLRRHPRLTSTTTVAVAAAVLVLFATTTALVGSRRLADLEARDAFHRFHEEMKGARFLLNPRALDGEHLDEGIARCRRTLDLYGVVDNPSWQDRPAVRRLSAADRDQLRGEVGDLLLLLARATALQAPATADRARQDEGVRSALRLNEQAEAVFPGAVPRAVWAQRAELASLLGQSAEAQRWREQAGQVPLRTARDYYLVAGEHLAQGRYRAALPLLLEATERDPQDFWARMTLGLCYDGLAQHAEARASYTTAIALWPEFPWAYFNRGLAALRVGDHRHALADFDQVLRLCPDLVDAYLNRALARQGLGDYAGGISDLTRAQDLGAPWTRIYFMRARLRDLAGDAEGARRDREEGLRREPGDEKSWVSRGLARLSGDLPAALADFEQALNLNPRSLTGLQNKAHVLSRLGRHEDGIRVLNRVVALYPDYVPARAGRGVLHGRLEHWASAREDAAECLARDTGPATLYQVAGIYALTSRENADDRREAFRLLASALRSGYGFEHLETDKDLDPIRALPEFHRLVEAARALQGKAVRTP